MAIIRPQGGFMTARDTGMRLFIRAMPENGIPEKDIEIMVKQNPARPLKV